MSHYAYKDNLETFPNGKFVFALISIFVITFLQTNSHKRFVIANWQSNSWKWHLDPLKRFLQAYINGMFQGIKGLMDHAFAYLFQVFVYQVQKKHTWILCVKWHVNWTCKKCEWIHTSSSRRRNILKVLVPRVYHPRERLTR